jgi:hypothetical protein
MEDMPDERIGFLPTECTHSYCPEFNWDEYFVHLEFNGRRNIPLLNSMSEKLPGILNYSKKVWIGDASTIHARISGRE